MTGVNENVGIVLAMWCWKTKEQALPVIRQVSRVLPGWLGTTRNECAVPVRYLVAVPIMTFFPHSCSACEL